MDAQDESVLMDFGDAMRAVQDGYSVKREAWTDKSAVVRLRAGKIRIFIGQEWRPWIISEDDVFGRDWMT